MSSIKLRKNAYTEYETTKNWSRKYAEREIEKHRMASSLDHMDGSVEVKHLSQGIVDLIREIPEEVRQEIEALKSGKLDDWKPLPLNADIDNLEDGFYYIEDTSGVSLTSETVSYPCLIIQKTACESWTAQIKISCITTEVWHRYADGGMWSDWRSLAGADVVDNLTSTSTTSALSANQGRVLKEQVFVLENNLSDAQVSLETMIRENNLLLNDKEAKLKEMLNMKMDEWKPIPVAGEIGEQYSDYDNLEDGFYYDVHYERAFLMQCTSMNSKLQLRIGLDDVGMAAAWVRAYDEGWWQDWVELKNPTPIDNLSSSSKALPLSANQGRVLKEMIDNIGTPTSQTLSPEMHRVTFRGKNLGSTVTAEQKTAIANGTFDDLFLGDYWVINDIVWRIVDMDYWYNTGTAIRKNTHHIVIMPDTCPAKNVCIDSTGGTSLGYYGTEMRTSTMKDVCDLIPDELWGSIFIHKEYLCNSAADGYPDGYIYADTDAELPSEIMMFGTRLASPSPTGENSFNCKTHSKTQLALFQIAPSFITTRESYWLRDIASIETFCCVNGAGAIQTNPVTEYAGVRPVFAIKGE